MKNHLLRRTKIVATIGPASSSPEMIRCLMHAGMDVARLNFSHGNYTDHAMVMKSLRSISDELDIPVTIMQDLQGPKIRVGNMAGGEIQLLAGEIISLLPQEDYHGEKGMIPIDYSHAAEEARPGIQVLLADGLFELKVEAIEGKVLQCRVIEGGILKSRKGVNFPSLNLRLPSLTEKDIADLDFGLSLNVDWISLSFVRSAEDIHILKRMLREKGVIKPVIAKIEKPQAIEHLSEIVEAADGIMVARGDLGVEMSPEKVPMLQKEIIEYCNRQGKPVITATQMLESMIFDPRPTRAEASDVANAIIDGTDAIMLSGETAMGEHPVKAVEMMARIAREVEAGIVFKTYPPIGHTENHALGKSANLIEKIVNPQFIVVLTSSGRSAQYVAAERPVTPVFAITTNEHVYHSLNLLWGIRPLLIHDHPETFEGLVKAAELTLMKYKLLESGNKILVMGGVPAGIPGGTNFVKIHTVA